MIVSSFKKSIALALLVSVAGGFSPVSFSVSESVPSDSLVQVIPSAAPININLASAEEIADVIKGVGLKKAEAIVAWRNEYGKFINLEQLLEVKGIGEKTLEKNRERIRF